MVARGKSSEVDAYVFIKDRLRMLGWDMRNPYAEESIHGSR